MLTEKFNKSFITLIKFEIVKLKNPDVLLYRISYEINLLIWHAYVPIMYLCQIVRLK